MWQLWSPHCRWAASRVPAMCVALLTTFLLAIPTANAEGTVFSILMKPSDDENMPSPQEYFEEMQMVLAPPADGEEPGGGAFGPDSGFSFLSKVDTSQDFAAGMVSLQECDLDPFWEKGKIVTDLKYCPLSMVKVVVYSLVPATAMFFGLVGLWSRQRNVGGRGKETQIGSLVSLGITLLNISYDWFFGWELFRNPRPGFQLKFSEFGLAHLIACAALNFLMVHFWFRRKFLVGMPWYEYHKHGIGLHLVFALMYAQPQAIVILHSRVFNSDLFNIHFGTPSKMNEVLSNVGCLSLLEDLPQFFLQLSVWMADTTGRDAPKVSRVSMALSCCSMAIVLKRQYIASVERQWYKEIVKMAGVKRLSVYGGASRWLKFQKRPSAAQDVKGGSTSQQQLFLAWMQSMGRRQESIFDNEDGGTNLKALGDDGSEDSEDDLDSLSDSSAEDEEGGDGSDGEGSEGAEGGESEEGEGSESEDNLSSNAEDDEVELQSYGRRQRDDRRRRPDAKYEGSDLDSGLLSSEDGLLGFARGVADDVSGTSAGAASESDIFAFARHVAGHASDSGVVTESGEDLNARGRRQKKSAQARRDAAFAQADVFSDSGSIGPDDAILDFARGVADDVSQAGTSDAGSGIFGFAREAAQGVSESGVGASVASGGSDIWAFARNAAGAVSVSGVQSSGRPESDIFAFARGVADNALDGGASSVGGLQSSAGGSDIFAFARNAADAVSQSGVGSDARPQRGGDAMAAARRAAEGSNSGVSSMGSGSDIFAFAMQAANDVSQSGVGSAGPRAPKRLPKPPSRPRNDAPSDAGSGMSDIFAIARAAAEGAASGAPSSVGTESDIFAMAQRAAGEVSDAGTHSRGGMSDIFARPVGGAQPRQRQQADAQSNASGGSESDIFQAAQNAAMEFSASGIHSKAGVRSGAFPMDNIFADAGAGARSSGSAKAKASPKAQNQPQPDSDSESDIFEAVRKAAGAASVSGIASASAVRSRVPGMDNIFAQVGAPAPKASPGGRRLPPAPPGDNISNAGSGTSEMDLFALARGAADEMSGVQSSVAASRVGAGGMADMFGNATAGRQPAQQRQQAPPREDTQSDDGDLFALARGAADNISGVQSSVAASRVGAGMGDLFGNARRQQPPQRQQPQQASPQRNDDSQSGAGSDIFAAARNAADEMSVVSGVSGDSGSDIFGAARRAADELSQSGASRSGVGTRSIGGMSDIFASARQAAADTSQAGSASQSGVGSGLDIFAVARGAAAQAAPPGQRRFNPDGRHQREPPLSPMAFAAQEPDADQPPWAVPAPPPKPLPGVPPPPPKSARRPPSPPGTPPPFDSIPLASAAALMDMVKGGPSRSPSPPVASPARLVLPVPAMRSEQERSPRSPEEALPGGQMLRFAREIAAAAGAASPKAELTLPRSSDAGLEGLFLHRSPRTTGTKSEPINANRFAKVADPYHLRAIPKVPPKSAGPPELPAKLRTPLTSTPLPPASRVDQPPSPRSLRAAAQRQRGSRQRPPPPTTASPEEGELVEDAAEKVADSGHAHSNVTNIAAGNDSSSAAYYMLTQSMEAEAAEASSAAAPAGSADYFMTTEASTAKEQKEAAGKGDGEVGAGSTAYFMLTQSPDPPGEPPGQTPARAVEQVLPGVLPRPVPASASSSSAASASGKARPAARSSFVREMSGEAEAFRIAAHELLQEEEEAAAAPPEEDAVCSAKECTLPKSGKCSRCPGSFCRDHMVKGGGMCQKCYSDHISLSKKTQELERLSQSPQQRASPARAASGPQGLNETPALPLGARPSSARKDANGFPEEPKSPPRSPVGRPQLQEPRSPYGSPTAGRLSDLSPPSSPDSKEVSLAEQAARQHRLHLRQARLRDGLVQDKDYKRKKNRTGTREMDAAAIRELDRQDESPNPT